MALVLLSAVLLLGTASLAHADPPKFTPGWFNQNTGNPQPGFKPGGMPPGQFPAGNPGHFPGNG
jgi:hypothetical protein